MRAAAVLFLVAILYRLIAGDVSSEYLWLFNFSPIAALALCGPVAFPRRVALALPLASLLVSDIFLNAHYGFAMISLEMLARYVALIMISIVGLQLRGSRSVKAFLAAGAGGSVSFYLITNTASWLTDPDYVKTFGGWVQALTVGLPGYPPTWLFFCNSFAGDMCFTALFLGCVLMAQRSGSAAQADLSANKQFANQNLCR